MSAPRYAELQVTSPFSFLRGASSAEELFATAALMGIEALAVTDRNTLSGIVRAREAAKATGVRLASETDWSRIKKRFALRREFTRGAQALVLLTQPLPRSELHRCSLS